MTERNTFVDVVDGDQLNQGYFNGIGNTFSYALTQDIIQNLNLLKMTLTSGYARITEDSFIYDLCKNRSVIDTDNTDASLIDVSAGDATKPNFWGAMTIYDDCNDDSYSTDNWDDTTGGTTGESGGGVGNNETSYAYITRGGGGWTGTVDIYAKAKDFKAGAKNATIYIKTYLTTDGPSGQTYKLRMYKSDGSGSVDLYTSASGTHIFRIEINYAGQTATVYKDEATVAVATNVNISSLASWCIGAHCNGDGETASSQISIYYMRYIDTITTQYVYRDMTTASATVTKAILYTNDDLTYGSMARTISADNGSNYESFTNKDLTQFTNTGTQVIPKIAITSIATQTAKLKEYGIIYLGAC